LYLSSYLIVPAGLMVNSFATAPRPPLRVLFSDARTPSSSSAFASASQRPNLAAAQRENVLRRCDARQARDASRQHRPTLIVSNDGGVANQAKKTRPLREESAWNVTCLRGTA
jgi:hypothetical protein